MIRIILLEDEPRMREALEALLEQEGYAVDAFSDGFVGAERIVDGSYDLGVLDVGLPGCSGYEVTRVAREAGISMPILLLTARGSIEEKVTGLDSGADDYLTKPFDTRELLARLRVMVRREGKELLGGLSYGDLLYHPEKRTLENTSTSTAVVLSVKEGGLLEALLRRKGIITREQLALQAFGYQDESEYNKVEVYLTFLRRKLAFLESRVLIKAERGQGYHLQESDIHHP